MTDTREGDDDTGEHAVAQRAQDAAKQAVGRAESAADRAEGAAEKADERASDAEHGAVVVEEVVRDPADIDDAVEFLHHPSLDPDELGVPGRPLNKRSPFWWGLLGGLGALFAIWIALMVVAIRGVLVLIVVALFLAVGLNPAVELLMRRGMRRPWEVFCVIT